MIDLLLAPLFVACAPIRRAWRRAFGPIDLSGPLTLPPPVWESATCYRAATGDARRRFVEDRRARDRAFDDWIVLAETRPAAEPRDPDA